MPDLFRALVQGVVERDALVQAAAERAATLPLPPIAGREIPELAADIVRLALVASVMDLRGQLRVAVGAVQEAAAAVKITDPRKVRAVTDIDVAERKAALIRADTGPGTPPGGPAREDG